VKGSFTGAVRDKQGLFAAARGGTFFLDEIGEMSPATQVKLLRVLQEREAIPVGGTEAIPVDVRVVAATNRDLEDDIKRGRFRTDLYYRLNVIAIHLPPLRERRDDIPIFVDAFLKRIAGRGNEPPKRLVSWNTRPGTAAASGEARSRSLATGSDRTMRGTAASRGMPSTAQRSATTMAAPRGRARSGRSPR